MLTVMKIRDPLFHRDVTCRSLKLKIFPRSEILPKIRLNQDPAENLCCLRLDSATRLGTILGMINSSENYIDPVPPSYTRKYSVRSRPLPEGCNVDQPDEVSPTAEKFPLTRGLFAIVDRDMVPDLMRFSWSAAPDYRTCYALTRDADGNSVRMHRHVLRINKDVDVHIDHINGNGLDNRRENLRVATRSENANNRQSPPKKTKNRFRGVRPGSVRGFTSAYKDQQGKTRKKNFDDEVEAAMYYDQKIVEVRGPKATTNLSMGRYTPAELARFMIGPHGK